MYFEIDIDNDRAWRKIRITMRYADGKPCDVTYMARVPIFGLSLRLRWRMSRMKRRWMKISDAMVKWEARS